MKKVFTSESLVTVAHYRNLLEIAGIRTEIRNQNLGSIVGELPFTEAWPQLWVVHPLDVARAEEIIAEAASAPDSTGPAWRCGACGTENDSQFAACWHCGAMDP